MQDWDRLLDMLVKSWMVKWYKYYFIQKFKNSVKKVTLIYIQKNI